MAEIHILDKNTVDQIAAGEVVERPSSVVKELVENAMDAGATAITVEIHNGGIDFIRITDNGDGIEESQIKKAFLRHATSKLERIEDLFTLNTLGFRGEALSSIASVAMVEMITKTSKSLTGTRYIIEGGEEKECEEVGAPKGTTIIVRNLFFNTPVRKKFLKSARTEASYVADLMEHLALDNPNVSFHFINNKDDRFHTNGNGDLKELIYRIYGRDVSMALVPIKVESCGIVMEGYLGEPSINRSNRNYEIFFVNGRYIKDRVMSKAIEEGYKQYLMQHKFPFCVLHFRLDPDQIDVNVHPSKMEIKFQNQHELFEFIRIHVDETLRNHEMIPEALRDEEEDLKVAALSKKAKINPDGSIDFFGTESEFKKNGTYHVDKKAPGSFHGEFELSGKQIGGGFTNDYVKNEEDFSEIKNNQVKEKSAEPFETSRFTEQQKKESKPVFAENVDIKPVRIEDNDINPIWSNKKDTDDNSLPNKTELFLFESDKDNTIIKNDENRSEFINVTDTANLTEVKAAYENKEGLEESNRDGDLLSSLEEASDNKENSPENSNFTGKVIGQPLDNISEYSSPILKKSATTFVEKPVQMKLFDEEEKMLTSDNRRQYKIIGQVFNTYWILEFKDKLYVVDQHAAHEKVNFEHMMASFKNKNVCSQMVNPPVIMTFSAQEEEIYLEFEDYFSNLGFQIDHFGGKEYAMRAIPQDLFGCDNAKEMFLEILGEMSHDSGHREPNVIYYKIASMACKASVKGNMRMSVQEMEALIDELLTLENPYNCPHGRPTIISMSKYELEKRFKRVMD